jgi:two-component system sensor histidine kinase BaeS
MADIAHELRTPVSVLKGEVEALADGVRRPDPAAFVSLGEEIEQLSKLVSDLQALALADAGALELRQERLDLVDLLRQVGEGYRKRLAARNVGLELHLPERQVLSADPQRLRQLFQNLLENCNRYVDRGGQVRIRIERGADAVQVTVEDSGPGVIAGQRAHLFERFYRAEESRSRASGGSGLGLAICRSIAEAHGGAITAEPSPLGGLAIHVELPEGRA